MEAIRNPRRWNGSLFGLLCAAFLTAFPLFAQQPPEQYATITGHVLTADGRPLAGASIDALPLEATVSGLIPAARSNLHGEFRLTFYAVGKVRLSASLQDAGYPETRFKFFTPATDQFPVLQLTPGAAIDNIDIRMPPPDGILSGVVVDTATQVPLQSARITLRWNSAPSVFYSTGIAATGAFTFALPGRPISLEISAPGYATMQYRDVATGESFVDLKSGEHRNIRIELKKK